METKNTFLNYNKGTIVLTISYKDDPIKSSIAEDIFRRIPDCEYGIGFITKIICDVDYLDELLTEFEADKEKLDDNVIYIANVGSLVVNADKSTIEYRQLTAIRNNENRVLNKHNFVNVKWTNSMFKTYTMTDTCMYQNAAGKTFIEEYSKDHADNKYLKLINRVYIIGYAHSTLNEEN